MLLLVVTASANKLRPLLMVQSEDESAQGCRLVSGGTEGGIHRGAESSSSVLVERLSFQAMPILRLLCAVTPALRAVWTMLESGGRERRWEGCGDTYGSRSVSQVLTVEAERRLAQIPSRRISNCHQSVCVGQRGVIILLPCVPCQCCL